MKKFFKVDLDYIIYHPETVCAENAEEAEQAVRDHLETPDFTLRMLRGEFAGDPIDPHVFAVTEIKPTDAEIQEVRDWADNMVGSMAMDDTEFVHSNSFSMCDLSSCFGLDTITQIEYKLDKAIQFRRAHNSLGVLFVKRSLTRILIFTLIFTLLSSTIIIL